MLAVVPPHMPATSIVSKHMNSQLFARNGRAAVNVGRRSEFFRTFEAISVFFLIFSVSGVTIFARSLATWEDLICPVILAAFSSIYFIVYSIRISYRFIFFIFAYISLTFLQSMIYGSIHSKQLLLYPLNFISSYCYVRAMGRRFFTHVELQIFALSAITVVIWSFDTLTSGAIRHGLKGITVGAPYSDIVDSYIVLQTFINEGVDALFKRNSGFCWEPGAFSVMCNVALMINLYRTKFKIRRNFRAFILVAAIISSQSTTGYSILFIFILLKFWHDLSSGYRLLIFPLAAASMIFAVSALPFMQAKIEDLSGQDIKELVNKSSQDWNKDKPIAAQRFLSFTMDFSDFLNNPLTGYGGEESQMLSNRESYNIVSISGIGKILARFGILGFVFFTSSTLYSSYVVSRQFSANSPLMLFLFIACVSISYSIVEHPLFICLWCYGFFGGGVGFKRVSR
ncbi:hypothetical protein [Novosphingobium pituita]|uniref:hypothetical protein n=1 Tax=Novosphingobium pituita TaxID=3056842 RepID=UPI00295E5D6F|nr:hypothetical protein [Novosphingobium sp. IK01]